jgi:hypothetical protein
VATRSGDLAELTFLKTLRGAGELFAELELIEIKDDGIYLIQ